LRIAAVRPHARASTVIDPVWIKAVLKALVLPPVGPLLLAVAGLALLGRHPRGGRAIAAAGVIVVLALSLPPVAYVLMRTVDASPPLTAEAARAAKAIVILGGGVRRNAPEYGGDTLGHLTLERVRYGARVARQTGLPVLVTGGIVFRGTAEAELMRAALSGEFGVPVRWIEPVSRNTRENAARSAELLRPEGIDRVVLVAHAFDIPRARAEFAAQGIAVVPAPTGIPTGDFDTLLDWLPGIGALQASYYALYEMLGLAVQRATALVG
jgi:uncharacterized SAM-binding protein YcdF (DUF218 family)